MDFIDLDQDDFVENDLEIIDIVDYGFPARIYERSNYFEDLDELQFFQRFRLSKQTVLRILQEVEQQLEFPNDLNQSVSPINQLLTCLRFFASAGHLCSVADYMGMHVSTVSRIISKVSATIAQLAPQYVKMPTVEERIVVQYNFFGIASFPRVLGCVNGTHIRIQSPGGDDAEVFRNRKSYFSINTQVIGDAQLKIRDIVARWPGSTHDMTIFTHSRIRAKFEEEFPNTLLLGDSGYSLSPYFLTPLQNPTTRGEQLYNEAQIRTRNTIERLFGVWKRRFAVLAYGLRLKLRTVLSVIVAAAVLHNVAVDRNEGIPPPPPDLDIEELNYLIEMANVPDVPNYNAENNAAVTRNELITNYFNNL